MSTAHDTLKLDWRLFWQEAREQIDFACANAQTSSSTKRKCPDCGGSLNVTRGRWSGKFWYTHNRVADCFFDSAFQAVKFDSKEAAESAEQIFT